MAEVDLLAELPDGVRRAQGALAAPSRLAIMVELMREPKTFGQLLLAVDVSPTALRMSLLELDALGWVSDDSAPGRQRKSATATYTADRARVLRDINEVTLLLAH